jgi:hypothetical protein
MVGITATWFLLGCGLGLRFKVLILVPAVISAMLGAGVVGIARGDDYWFVVVAMILFGTAVQFGYLAGIITREVIAPSAPATGGHKAEIARSLAAGITNLLW